MQKKSKCGNCPHRKDLNSIIPWADPSRMFYDWKCFYDIDSTFENVLNIYNADEGKSIPDLRYDLYNSQWITMGFNCPVKEKIK